MADLEHELAMLNPVFAEMVNGIDRAMGQMADSIAEGIMEGKLSLDSFQDIARNFVQGLIAEFIKTYVIKSIMRSAMGFMGFDAGMLGIGQSAGAEVIHPSTPKIVGERGPELFVPHSAGNIVNNANSKSALGGGPSVSQIKISMSKLVFLRRSRADDFFTPADSRVYYQRCD